MCTDHTHIHRIELHIFTQLPFLPFPLLHKIPVFKLQRLKSSRLPYLQEGTHPFHHRMEMGVSTSLVGKNMNQTLDLVWFYWVLLPEIWNGLI